MPASDGEPAPVDAVAEIDDLLEGRHPPGRHAFTSDAAPGDVASALGAAGWRGLALALSPGTSKDALLTAFATAGGFPDWFGGNWDALEDALRDLSWAPADGYVVLLDGWTPWAEANLADAATLADVLDQAATWWEADGTPFHVLVRG